MKLLKGHLFISFLISVVILLTSCASKSTPITITLTPTKAILSGKVYTSYSGSLQPLKGTVVRLAKVFWNSDKTDGAFVLEGASSPSAITNQNGEFAFGNIAPADYVIVVGDAEGDNEIIGETNGKAKIYQVQPDKILDVGILKVKLRPSQ
jgi:hypothetical protein